MRFKVVEKDVGERWSHWYVLENYKEDKWTIFPCRQSEATVRALGDLLNKYEEELDNLIEFYSLEEE